MHGAKEINLRWHTENSKQQQKKQKQKEREQKITTEILNTENIFFFREYLLIKVLCAVFLYPVHFSFSA